MRERALALLARREHSSKELQRKLEARGFSTGTVEGVIAGLQADRLQSDRRFTETYIRHRVERGYGPLRIRAELREKGVDDSLAQEMFEELGVDWTAVIAAARQKRFGLPLPGDFAERGRQSRFLQQRGFSGEQISKALRGDEPDN